MGKSRYWATEIYEESVNKYYIDILSESAIQIAISPIHNKDTYTEYDIEKYNKTHTEPTKNKVGDTKKAHRHILLAYDNPTTEKNVKELVSEINGVGLIAVKSKKGYYEYLTHKNEKDKYKYNEEDIIKLNNFEITETEDTMTDDKKEELKRLIISIINEKDIEEYKEIYDYINLEIDDINMLKVLSRNTIFFNAYLKSKAFVNKKKIIEELEKI